jgi:hypothetical protein
MVMINGLVPNIGHEHLKFVPKDLLQESLADSPQDGDDTLYVTFFNDQELKSYESEVKQIPVFKTSTFISIRKDENYTACLRVDEQSEGREFITRFPEKWNFFKSIQEGKSGTPIRVLNANPNLLAALDFVGIDTVEALINTPDASLIKFEGAIELKRSTELKIRGERSEEQKQNELAVALAEIEKLKAQIYAENGTTNSSGRLPEHEVSTPKNVSRK